MIKDSGQRTEFNTGAVRDMQGDKGRFDLLPWNAIWQVAKHCEEGAKKYGERNVEKGIPQHSFIDSAYRHITKYMLGYTDENHLRAACWNLLFALEQETTHPELIDLPNRDKPKETEDGLHLLDGEKLAQSVCDVTKAINKAFQKKPVFKLEDYEGNYVMHCNTEEKANIFLKYLHKNGRKWCNGESYLKSNMWEIERENTIYYFNEGFYNSVEWEDDCRCTILEFDDFKWKEAEQ